MSSSSSSQPVVAALRTAFAAAANAPRAAQQAAYFSKHKGLCFYGLDAKGADRIAEELAVAVARGQSPGAILQLAEALISDPYMEMKRSGHFVLYRLRTQLLKSNARDVFESVGRIFDAGSVDDWATCDALACRVLTAVIVRDRSVVPLLHSWPLGANPWKARAACVCYVKLCSHQDGLQPDLLRMCDSTLRQHSSDRFAQLGVGWVLKELAVQDMAAVEAFISAHYSVLSREALRVSLEKAPAGRRAALMKGPTSLLWDSSGGGGMGSSEALAGAEAEEEAAALPISAGASSSSQSKAKRLRSGDRG